MLKNYSYSSLESYRTCPRQFKFQYIDRSPKEPTVSAVAYLGNAVHRVLNQIYKLGGDGIVMTIDQVTTEYDAAWEKIDRDKLVVKSDYHTIDDYIRIGREMLFRYYDKFKPFDEATLLGSELSLTFNLPGTGFKFKGQIDRLLKFDDGRIEICDYKTGEMISRPKDIRFRYQMGLYQMAVAENYPDYDNIELAQYYLRKDETVRYRMSVDELELITDEIRNAVLDTIRAERLDDFPTKEGDHCRWCEYYKLCPAKRHRELLDQQEAKDSQEIYSPENLSTLADEYLNADEKFKQARFELEELKEKVKDAVRSEGLSSLEGSGGAVKVSLKQLEKFITKTADVKSYNALNMLCRDLQLDEYFKIDASALLKDIYNKKRLPDEDHEKLRQFITIKESAMFRVKRVLSSDDDE